MNTKYTTVCGLIGTLALSAVAAAQINTVGPFTGDASEDFVGHPGGFHACLPNRVLDARADMCSPSGGGMHVTGGWSFACSISPFVGNRLFGSGGAATSTVLTFDATASRFGAYFGTNSGNEGPGTADFYDVNGVLIGTMPIDYRADCQWYWNGWESSTPIKEIEFRSTRPAGNYLMMDGLEVVWDSGTVPCYPDCDGSGVLDFFDFLCFQNAFLAGDPYADCDQSGVLDFFDFLCFQNEFIAGCP
jgi:hypothetical protein